MLVLGIKPGDYIVVGDNIVIQAIEFDNQIRMGIDAPKDVTIMRGAVYEENNPPPKCIQRSAMQVSREQKQRV